MKFLFVCLGNICRSPIAHGIFEYYVQKHQLDWIIDSAAVANYHIGERPHIESQKICQTHGIDISNQRARKITGHELSEFDVIIVMDNSIFHTVTNLTSNGSIKNKIKLITDFDKKSQFDEVPDPYYGGPEDFSSVYKLLDDLCQNILDFYLSKK